MRDDPKCKYRAEAKLILELIHVPHKRKERFDALQIKMREKRERDQAMIKKGFRIIAIIIALAVVPGVAYYFAGR